MNKFQISKHTLVWLFLLALIAYSSMGCHTANGFGKDMQDAGEGIQKGTK